MDPASILSLVLAAGKVVEVCASTGLKLKLLRDNYKDAPSILLSIEGQCDTLQVAVNRIKTWADLGHPLADETSSQSLNRCLQRCHLPITAVERKISQISSGVVGPTPRWERSS
jgi:hypothetical protein